MEQNYTSSLQKAERKICTLLARNKGLKTQLDSIKKKHINLKDLMQKTIESANAKKDNARKVNIKSNDEISFLKRRVKECFGHEGYLKMMKHIECPRGAIDEKNYKVMNEITR